MEFRIRLRDTTDQEIEFTCHEGQTIADAGETAGYRLISCASGYCGACAVQLLNGEVAPSASGTMGTGDILLCRCTAKSDLVARCRHGWLRLPQASQSTATV